MGLSQAGSFPTSPSGSIATYWTDVLASGGLSILIAVPLLWLESAGGRNWTLRDVALLSLLVNAPHFAASWRLLYTAENVRKHPWAAYYVPIVLVVLCLCALLAEEVLYANLFNMAAAVYLAWHYTGQAFGMMATFSAIERNPFSARERFAIQLALRMLLAWHALGVLRLPSPKLGHPFGVEGLDEAYRLLALLLGSAAIGLWAWRTRRAPSLRVVAPWLALNVWYLAMSINWTLIYWVQMFHALQYLPFAARVELNRGARVRPGRPRWRHMAAYALGLLATAVAITELIPYGLVQLFGLEAAAGGGARAALWFSLVNIHHYFVDGALWKLRDKDVQRDLLSHLR